MRIAPRRMPKDTGYIGQRPEETVADMLKKFGGDSAIIVGHGPTIQRLRYAYVRAVSRHRAFWLVDEIPPEGATVKDLRDRTGAGKKRIRSRLRDLESAGLVEQREMPRKCPDAFRWFKKEAA